MYNYRLRASVLRPKITDAPLTQRYLRINSLCILQGVIDQTVTNIGLYTKNLGDFTRNRKLNAATTLKVTLNM